MNIQARPYRDSTDFVRMRQLLMDGRQAAIPASYMHPGCLDWDTHRPPDEQANRRNLRLWESMNEDPPTLEAWAIFSRHEGSFERCPRLSYQKALRCKGCTVLKMVGCGHG
jgi:hypothetical protein